MGDRLRLRAPDGSGAKPAAHFPELDGIRARLVRTQATRRQEMDEFVAASAGSVGLFAAGRAGACSDSFAIQSACRTAAAGSSVFFYAPDPEGSPPVPPCLPGLFGGWSTTLPRPSVPGSCAC